MNCFRVERMPIHCVATSARPISRARTTAGGKRETGTQSESKGGRVAIRLDTAGIRMREGEDPLSMMRFHAEGMEKGERGIVAE